MAKKILPTNDDVSEYAGQPPKNHTATTSSREGIKHKPDTEQDLYNRRQRRSRQHV